MLLVVDVGNTNIVLGVYDGAVFKGSWRISADPSRTSDETGNLIASFLQRGGLNIAEITDGIISTVKPDMMYSLMHGLRKYFGITPMQVDYRMKMKLRLPGYDTDTPSEIGADRIVNCEAALHLYKPPFIIIDYGTATTYDAVDKNGVFVTGVTSPGIKIAADALFTRAALLGRVEIKKPESVVARNTIESIQAGIVYGAIGETEYIVRALIKELKLENCLVIATGGLARALEQGTDIFNEINPQLTLLGLRYLYEQNK